MATKGFKPKAYACNRFPNLSIRDEVKFEGGKFTARTQKERDLVESSDWYEVHIHPCDVDAPAAVDDGEAEVAEAVRLATLAEEGPRIRNGQVSTR